MELNNVNDTNQPDFLSVAYQAMMEHWPLIATLVGGTKAMRDAHELYLPKHERETEQHYRNRLCRSFLFPGYKRGLGRIVAKPFAKPVVVKGELPPRLEPLIKDADGLGGNLTSFCREIFKRGVDRGKCHLLVDMQSLSGEETLAEERRVFPNFVAVGAEQLLGWKTNADGDFTEARIHEIRNEQTGKYGDVDVEFIRVYTDQEVIVFRKTDNEWTEESSKPHRFGRVPLLTFYSNKTGHLTALPALDELGWVNLNHWQSSSDQNNVLSFARTGILFGKKLGQDEHGNPAWKNMSIGPHQGIFTEDGDSDLKIVEHSGDAIGAGRADLDNLEEEMDALGLQPFIQRSGDITATGRAIDEASTQTDIQAWIVGLEGVIRDAFELGGEWTKESVPEDLKIDINNDFGISLRADRDIKALQEARRIGDLTPKAYLENLRRLGVFTEDFDVDAELEAVEQEAQERLQRELEAAAEFSNHEDDDDTVDPIPNPRTTATVS